MAVAEAVTVPVPVPVALVNFVVNSLHMRYGVSLHNGDGNLDQFHNWYFNDLFNWDRVVNMHLYNLLVRDFHDFLDGVGDWFVDLNVLDLDDGYGNVLDDGYFDGVRLGDRNLDSMGYWYGHRLGYSVCHLPKDLVRLFTDVVLSGSAVAVSKTVDLFDDGSLRAW